MEDGELCVMTSLMKQMLWLSVGSLDFLLQVHNCIRTTSMHLTFPSIIGAKIQRFGFGQSTMPVWLGHIQCNGFENNILDCGTNPRPNCHHTQDVGILCLPGNASFLTIKQLKVQRS